MGEAEPEVAVHLVPKILVSIAAGGFAYLLTNITEQPKIWQLTMSIFVGGIVLVVQYLIFAAEQSQKVAVLVGKVHEAANTLAESESVLGGDSLTRLVKAAGSLERREDLQLRFAVQQVDDLTTLFKGLKAERASHQGEHPDWLLGLTELVTTSIDATSLTSFGEMQGYADEGAFWDSELGRRFLARQRLAVERNVRIRRLFVLNDSTVDQAELSRLLEPHRNIGVETRVLSMEHADHLVVPADFIIFDKKICYEFQTSKASSRIATPTLETVALMVGAEHVQLRQRDFETLWAGAEA